MDISRAKEKIDELNTEFFTKKCVNMHLSIEIGQTEGGSYYSSCFKNKDMPILCLYFNSRCISSIILSKQSDCYPENEMELTDYEDTMQLLSMTGTAYEGNKYNKLLRAVAIIIGNLIIVDGRPIKQYLSFAKNAISAWLLSQYYDVEYSDNSAFYYYMKEYSELDLKQLFNNFLNEQDKTDGTTPIVITLKLDENNRAKAYAMFHSLLETIQCQTGGKGKMKMTKKGKKGKKWKQTRKGRKSRK